MCVSGGWRFLSLFSFQGHMHLYEVSFAPYTHPLVLTFTRCSCFLLNICNYVGSFSDQGVCSVPCSEPAASAPSSRPVLDMGAVGEMPVSSPTGWVYSKVCSRLPPRAPQRMHILWGFLPFTVPCLPSALGIYRALAL